MIALNGIPCHRAELQVPWTGSWIVKVALDATVAPAGPVTLTWGNATLIGTVDPTSSGVWQGEAFATVIGGIGWRSELPAGWLQNDAGLQGASVAQQAATLAGEVLTAPATAFRLLRVSYARVRRPASRVLQDVLAMGMVWWVEYGGTTRAGARVALPVPPRVEVLEYDPLEGWADLDADDVGQTLIGSVIQPAPPRRIEALRIVELCATADGAGQRIRAGVEVIS